MSACHVLNLDNLEHPNGNVSGLLVGRADGRGKGGVTVPVILEIEWVVISIVLIIKTDLHVVKHFALGLNGRATLSNVDVHRAVWPSKWLDLFGHPNSTVPCAFVGGHVKGWRWVIVQRLGPQGGIWIRESDISVGKCRPDFDRASGLNDYAQTHDGLGVACIALTLGALRLTCERGRV